MSLTLTGAGRGAPGGGGGPSTLLDGLTAYWLLSGPNAATGAPDWTPGPESAFAATTLSGVGAAHELVVAEGDEALAAGNALPILAATDATIFLWARLTDLTSFWTAFGKVDNLGDTAQIEYAIYYRQNLGEHGFIVSDGTNTSTATGDVDVVADTYYAILAEWYAAAGKAYITINDGPRQEGVNAGTPVPTARTMELRCGYDGSVYPWRGGVSSVGRWERLLTAPEKAELMTGIYPWS